MSSQITSHSRKLSQPVLIVTLRGMRDSSTTSPNLPRPLDMSKDTTTQSQTHCHTSKPTLWSLDFRQYFAAMVEAQKRDPEIQALQSSPLSSLKVESIPVLMSTDTILCDMSTGPPHPLVPPRIRATRQLFASRYVWTEMNSDVRRWTRPCIQCQRSKEQHHTHPTLFFSNP